MTTQLQARSYAKINWTLDVLFKRQDGYHELRTIYQTISLSDHLRLSETSAGIEIVCDDPAVPTDASNLVLKAAALLRETMGLSRGAHIEIEKKIPVAGGLGGGSSNAACVLLGLARLWGLDLPRAALVGLAGRLGSDVPFFLVGGTALGIGRGEEVYPIEEVTCDCLVLVNPGIPASTAAVYEMHSRLTRVEAVRKIPFTLVAASDIRGLPFAARNDLEEAAEAAYPEIAEVKRRLLGLGARRALMSGSGATVVGLFDNTEAGRQATDRLQADGYWSIIARAIDRREYHRTMFS